MLAEIQTNLPRFAAQLGDAGLAQLLTVAAAVHLAPGEKLLRSGQPTDSLYLVVAGTLAAQVQHGTQTVKVGAIGPGDWIGEVSVLSGLMTASADVVADADVTLLRLRHQAFFALTETFNPLADALVRMLVVTLAARVRGYAARPIPVVPLAPPDAGAPPPVIQFGWLAKRLGLRSTKGAQ